MARRNSITMIAESVEVSKGIDGLDKTISRPSMVLIKIKNPSEDDLIRLISECSSLLEWRRNRSELPEGAKE